MENVANNIEDTCDTMNNLDKYAVITCNNCTISKVEEDINSSLVGKSRGIAKNIAVNSSNKCVSQRSYITFTANEIEGKVFNYFKNSHDEIVSYDKIYSDLFYTDEIITAVYSNIEVEKKNTLYLNCATNPKLYLTEKYPERKYLAFTYGCIVADGYKIKDIGRIYSKDADNISDEDFVLNTTNKSVTTFSDKAYLSNLSTVIAEIWVNFTQSCLFKFKAYVVVEKDGIEETYYSKMFRYNVDF